MKKMDCLKSHDIILSIAGKKILFFAPAFFSYENKIASKMETMGAIVDIYDVRSITSARDRALLKISPDFFKKQSISYYEEILEKNKEKDYDYILIVKCDMTPVDILKKFRLVFPNAKLCLYLWDSVKNISGVLDKFQYFDTLHSFDLSDCKQYTQLKFRPLFYTDEFHKDCKAKEYKYDISFTGTIHSDRYDVIKQVRKIAEDKNLRCFWFCYLQSKFIYYFYKVTKREFRRTQMCDFNFEKMGSKDIAYVVDGSKAVLDIQHPKQTGLTMRTIEMVGMNKKLITTNASIKEYDFYDPSNICIINRNNVELDYKFLYSHYKPLNEDVYRYYSLSSWILEVLS